MFLVLLKLFNSLESQDIYSKLTLLAVLVLLPAKKTSSKKISRILSVLPTHRP